MPVRSVSAHSWAGRLILWAALAAVAVSVAVWLDAGAGRMVSELRELLPPCRCSER
jgi:hypothetical protein